MTIGLRLQCLSWIQGIHQDIPYTMATVTSILIINPECIKMALFPVSTITTEDTELEEIYHLHNLWGTMIRWEIIPV